MQFAKSFISFQIAPLSYQRTKGGPNKGADPREGGGTPERADGRTGRGRWRLTTLRRHDGRSHSFASASDATETVGRRGGYGRDGGGEGGVMEGGQQKGKGREGREEQKEERRKKLAGIWIMLGHFTTLRVFFSLTESHSMPIYFPGEHSETNFRYAMLT